MPFFRLGYGLEPSLAGNKRIVKGDGGEIGFSKNIIFFVVLLHLNSFILSHTRFWILFLLKFTTITPYSLYILCSRYKF